LRQRASRHHRSLQGELMAIVEQALQQDVVGARAGPQPAGSPRVVGHDKHGWPIVRQGSKSPEQVIAELRAKHPQPVAKQLSSVEIIRAERDAR
jgi:hypothetical protein